ncbi:hypothetical protein GmHk_15G044451 [Glycine max]|nr:hypothetical protein GmHk_15G044451 [Glycine max]
MVFSRRFGFCSVLQAEIWGIMYGLQMAAEAEREHLHVATNSLQDKDSFRSEEHSGIDLSGKTNAEHDISNNTQGSSEGVEHQTNSVGDIHRTHFQGITKVHQFRYRTKNWKIDEPENACKKQVESPNNNIEAEDVKEISHVVYKETGKASKVEVKDVKLNHPKEVQVNSVSKGSNAAKTKKKSMLPTSKASPISTPKSSKPA